jgi:8-oxo-dGTP pyrophosphatase MutT (NUDIX family)
MDHLKMKIAIIRFLLRIYYSFMHIIGGKSVGARAIVLSEDLEKILLVYHTYCPNWHLPGGGVKKGEHPFEAVVREVYEETGVKCLGSPEFFGVYYQKYMGVDDYPFVYVIQNWVQEKDNYSPEIKEIRWFSIFELPDDMDPGSLQRIHEYCLGGSPTREWDPDKARKNEIS